LGKRARQLRTINHENYAEEATAVAYATPTNSGAKVGAHFFCLTASADRLNLPTSTGVDHMTKLYATSIRHDGATVACYHVLAASATAARHASLNHYASDRSANALAQLAATSEYGAKLATLMAAAPRNVTCEARLSKLDQRNVLLIPGRAKPMM
jgi:hypothetical protein